MEESRVRRASPGLQAQSGDAFLLETPISRSGKMANHHSKPASHTFHSVKTKWTADEDAILTHLVNHNGPLDWTSIAKSLPRRTGKQCRERWLNQLCPALSKDPWTPQEDAVLNQRHRILGNSWAAIAVALPGRSPNAVKNRWTWMTKRTMPASGPSRAPERFTSPVSPLGDLSFLALFATSPGDPKRLVELDEGYWKAFEEFVKI
jgi:hypothetical protein